jgi:hypothetical protein
MHACIQTERQADRWVNKQNEKGLRERTKTGKKEGTKRKGVINGEKEIKKERDRERENKQKYTWREKVKQKQSKREIK